MGIVCRQCIWHHVSRSPKDTFLPVLSPVYPAKCRFCTFLCVNFLELIINRRNLQLQIAGNGQTGIYSETLMTCASGGKTSDMPASSVLTTSSNPYFGNQPSSVCASDESYTRSIDSGNAQFRRSKRSHNEGHFLRSTLSESVFNASHSDGTNGVRT